MVINTTDIGLLKLMQLVSTNLPVGGFSFSQGIESGCEFKWVTDKTQTRQWLATQIEHSLSYLELPVFFRIVNALQNNDSEQLNYWDSYLLANRETHELYLADSAMGQALRRLLLSLQVPCNVTNPCSFTTLFAIAVEHWQIEPTAGAIGFSWSWLENQIAAATKLVPLGQTQAQQLIGELQPLLPQAVKVAASLKDDELGASLPALAIASSLHEHQYSRLFRS